MKYTPDEDQVRIDWQDSYREIKKTIKKAQKHIGKFIRRIYVKQKRK